MKLITKTKAKETLKLSNTLRSYLFEQECGELEFFTSTQIKVLKEALKVLNEVVSKNKIL